MNPFVLLVTNLNAMGIFGFLLPWLFTFAVFFGLLVKANYFEDKRIIGVISLVAAFFLIGFAGPALASFFVTLFGLATIVIAAFLVIVLFTAMTGADVTKMFANKGVVAVLAGIGIIIATIAVGSYGVSINDSAIGVIFIILLLAVAIVFITK